MSTEHEPTVFLIDDDEPVRQAIGLLLKSSGIPCEVFSSGDVFLSAFDPERPGCVVVDMRMPGIGGLDLQARLAAEGRDIPVVIITGHGDVPAAVRAMKQGAVDFIEKPFNDQTLLDAVRRAIEQDARGRAEGLRRQENRDRFRNLTEREREVMALVVQGHPNKIIADELTLSIKTVEYHRGRVMNKMEVESVPDLVRAALDVDDEPLE